MAKKMGKKISGGEYLKRFSESLKNNNPPENLFFQNNCTAPLSDSWITSGDDYSAVGTHQRVETYHSGGVYPMRGKRRGCFLIFHHTEFQKELKLPKRSNSSHDHKKMEELARHLGFEHVHTFFDRSAHVIKETLKNFCDDDKVSHDIYDCFAMAIMSHGRGDGEVYANDGWIKIKELTDILSECKGYASKPKLLFIQACRGTKDDHGVEAPICPGTVQSDSFPTADSSPYSQDVSMEVDESQQRFIYVPKEADFLMAYSCSQDSKSYNTDPSGSWFVDALWREVLEHGQNLEIIQVLTKVSNRVCSYRQQELMQAPSIVSRLRCELYFKPKPAFQ